MGKNFKFTICLILMLFTVSETRAQFHLFDEPRKGGFKILENDNFDITNTQHFAGSGLLALGFYKIFQTRESKQAKLKAALLASSLGLLKELEDGFREGFGIKDTIFNELGIITFLLLSDYSHFTLTFEQLFLSSKDFGLGLRFFRTSEFNLLNGSLGFFVYYSNYKKAWLGVNSHFVLKDKIELHLGLALFNIESANQLNVRPSVGIAFKLL